ncbi:MAG: hypothetical protein AB7J28_09600 [Hyphomonadaceae bacterium]
MTQRAHIAGTRMPKKDQSGLFVRSAVLAVLGGAAVFGAYSVATMPVNERSPLAQQEQIVGEQYAAADPMTATDGTSIDEPVAMPQAEAVPEAAPAPQREARVTPRPAPRRAAPQPAPEPEPADVAPTPPPVVNPLPATTPPEVMLPPANTPPSPAPVP